MNVYPFMGGIFPESRAREVPVGGDPVAGFAILTLGRAMSGAIDIAVRLEDDGSLFVNGVDIDIMVTGSGGTTEN